MTEEQFDKPADPTPGNVGQTPGAPVNNGPIQPPPFQQPPAFGQFNGGVQNLPNATVVLVLGIISIPACCCYGVLGLIFAIIALVLAKKDRALYFLNSNNYTLSSFKNLNAGRVCAIIGLILSILYLVLIIIAIATFGVAALKDPQLMKEILESKGYQ